MQHKECSSCPNTDKCREVWSEENKGPLTSGGLVICSSLGFLLPILLGIIAGAISRTAGHSENRQILFTVLGFVLGASIGAFLVSRISKRFKRNKAINDCSEMLEN